MQPTAFIADHPKDIADVMLCKALRPVSALVITQAPIDYHTYLVYSLAYIPLIVILPVIVERLPRVLNYA